jgi:hypothetical protein
VLDADDALGLLGVVDEQHAPRLGREQLGVRDDADRPARAVDRDRGAVVDVPDLAGDVGDEVVGADVSGSESISARHGAESVTMRLVT